MLTLLGLGALLAFAVLQPAALRRWPVLESYALPPSSRPPGSAPLPWDIPLPPVASDPPLPPAPLPVRPVAVVEEARQRQRHASAFEQGYRQARAQADQMARDTATLKEYVQQQARTHAIHYSPSGYQSASLPGGPAHMHHIDPARNAYILTDGREIDRAYFDNLTTTQRVALLAGR